jgi:tetratricopeptide (TPR) repeat protein
MCLSIGICAQPAQDTSVIRQQVDSARTLIGTQPDEARRLSREVLRASSADFYYGTVNAFQVIGESYFSRGQHDSAIYYYRRALNASLDARDLYEKGNNYTSVASIYLATGAIDSSILYYQKAILAFEQRNDSSALCDVVLRFGNAQSQSGSHDEALSAFMRSLRICEALKREIYMAYNFGSIGIIHDKQGNYTKAEEYFLKALELGTKLGDLKGQKLNTKKQSSK